MLIFAHGVGFLRPFETAVYTVFDPVVHKGYSAINAVASRFFFKHVEFTNDEFRTVTRERDSLKTRIALVESENATLRRELQFPDRLKWQTVGADVIAKTADVTEQALILNRGAESGIVKGNVVFTEQGIFVGTIIDATDRRSYVRLINDRQSRVGALHATNSKPIGIVEGGYGLGVRLTLIPSEEVVAIGDLIETNDVSEFMPRGLLIGKVASVGRETYEPFQHALIEPAIGLDQVKAVTVIISK